MTVLKYQLLTQFFHDAQSLSRNRNYFAFSDPTVARVRRSGQLLRSLRCDLLERDLLVLNLQQRPAGTAESDGRPITITLHWDGGRRTSYLDELELQVLLEDQAVACLLREATRRAA